MMLEFKHPMPVVVEGNKDGYAIYVTDGGQFENDVWCVALCKGGEVRHYRSDQIVIHRNSTFDIEKLETKPQEYKTKSDDYEVIEKESDPKTGEALNERAIGTFEDVAQALHVASALNKYGRYENCSYSVHYKG